MGVGVEVEVEVEVKVEVEVEVGGGAVTVGGAQVGMVVQDASSSVRSRAIRAVRRVCVFIMVVFVMVASPRE
jgi:hypothetical protein